MLRMKNIVKHSRGLFFRATGLGRKNLDLQEALDATAECNGGYNTCKKSLLLEDRGTGQLVEVYIENGVLVVPGQVQYKGTDNNDYTIDNGTQA